MNQIPLSVESARPLNQLRQATETLSVAREKSAWKSILVAFLLLAPAVATLLYCFYVAAPEYRAEARFMIRGTEIGASSPLRNVLSGAGAAAAAFTDGFAVRDYLASYNALEKLDKEVGYVARMSRADSKEFGHLVGNESKEQLLAFYQRFVDVQYSFTEGIVIVDVYAYTPQDALAISAALVNIAEEFSNEMNRKSKQDSLKLALEELAGAEEQLTKARLEVNKWRKTRSNIDPVENTKMLSTIVGELESARSKALTELFQLDSFANSENAQRQAIEDRITAIEKQIEKERERLTGGDKDASMVNLLLEYERLILTQEFAAKAYEAAQQGLQNARLAADAKQKYVATVVSPSLPEDPAYPTPWETSFLVLVGTLLACGLGSLLLSAIRDSYTA